MTNDQIEKVISRTGHERLRALTSDANPDVVQRDAYRTLVEAMAMQPTPAIEPTPRIDFANQHPCCNHEPNPE